MNVGFVWLTCPPADAAQRIAAARERFGVIEIHGPFLADPVGQRVRFCLEVRL